MNFAARDDSKFRDLRKTYIFSDLALTLKTHPAVRSHAELSGTWMPPQTPRIGGENQSFKANDMCCW